jgi:hypothetical protein
VRVPAAAVKNEARQSPKKDLGKTQPEKLSEPEKVAVEKSQKESLVYSVFN